MKRIIIISIVLLSLFSCEKIYYPDENAYRDPEIVGTWQLPTTNDTILIVFTEQGYYDVVNYIDNENLTGYTGLAGIWQVVKKIDSITNIGQIYTKCTTSNFSHRGWENYEYYYLSSNNDTLYIGANSDMFDTYTKYRLQLIYEGGDWVDIDSTAQQ